MTDYALPITGTGSSQAVSAEDHDDAINAELTSLSNDISTEAAARASGDMALADDIVAEAAARDTAISAAIGALGDLAQKDTVDTADIAASAVTNAKMADMSEARFKGRKASAGSGPPQDMTASEARTAMGLGSAATTDASAYATAAQGATADAAVQPGDDVSVLAETSTAKIMTAAERTSLAALPGEIAAVDAAREAIIQDDGAETVFVDRNGRVSLRLRADGFDVHGRTRVRTDGELLVSDDEGFVLVKADALGIRILGRPVDDYAKGYLRDSLNLVRWRRALGRALMGDGAPRIVFLGDSNTMGWVSDGAGNSRRKQSHPYLLSQLFGGPSVDLFGQALGTVTTTAAYSVYDSRTSFGAGWAGGGVESLGGPAWFNSTTTDPVTLAPDMVCDRAEVWLYSASAATANITYSGVTTPVTLPGGEVVRTQVSGAAGSGAVNVARATGTVNLIGISLWNSTLSRPIVMNAGRSGLASAALAATANPFSPRNVLPSLSPDLVVVEIGLNDRGTAVTVTDFADNLRGIAAGVPTTSSLLFVASVSPARNLTPWGDYVAAMRTVSAEFDAAMLDLSTIMGTRPAVTAANWQTDDLHPSKFGNAEKARQIRKILEM